MIVKKVRMVIALKDDWSGKDLGDNLTGFFLNGVRAAPLLKRGERCFVFLDCPQRPFELEIKQLGYLSLHSAINDQLLANPLEVKNIRLSRDSDWYYSDCEWIVGEAKPDSTVKGIDNRSDEVKIHGLNEEKGTLQIFGGFPSMILGKKFLLKSTGEEFVLESFLGGNSYLSDILPKEGVEKGESIYPVATTQSDSTGKFYLPVEDSKNIDKLTVLYCEKESEKWVQVCVTALS